MLNNEIYEEEGKKEVDPIKDAVAQISILIQNCAVVGANDSEIPTLLRLISDVEAEAISPAEALAKAHKIVDSKQDYH